MKATTTQAQAQSWKMAEIITADAISALVGDPTLKDSKATAGAVIMARQIVMALERRGYASKGQVERCFEMINIMERE